MEKKTIKLHKFQDEAIFAPERFIGLVAGLQSGKTVSGAIWSRIQFDQFPKDDGLIAAPTYKILHQSTLPKFFEINADLKKYYKKGDSEIVVPNRGKIYIRSTENPNVIEGMTLRWIWADEAGQMKLDAWINFQGRLSILQGKLFITTTPYAYNWLATEFYEACKKGTPEYKIVQFRSIDNPYFSKEEFERVKQTMDVRTFRRRYCGMLEKMEGLVYEDFMPAIHVQPCAKFDFISWKEFICGIDWGFTNEAAIIVIGIDSDNGLWVVDEFYKSGKITAELIEQCKYFKDKYKIRFWYPDPAEPDRLEEMKKAGLFPREVKKGKGSVGLGIDKIRDLIKQGRFHVLDNCKYVQDELSMYHYPEATGGKAEDEEPVKENDHAMDAIRYAIATYQPETNITNSFTNNIKPIFK